MKGRLKGGPFRLTDDILYHADQENIGGILFSADIEKAFDSVVHDLIFAGFGNYYIQWVRSSLWWKQLYHVYHEQ